jgi:hypothetical protein
MPPGADREAVELLSEQEANNIIINNTTSQ